MNTIRSSFSQYEQAFENGQRYFGGDLAVADGDLRSIVSGTGLELLMGSSPDRAGFYQIEVDANRLPDAPELIGRVLLWNDRQSDTMQPALLMPQLNRPGWLRVARLPQPFVPSQGLTNGLRFGLSLEAKTQAPGFGGHGGSAGGFEGGHFGVSLTGAADYRQAQEIVYRGDAKSDEVIASGLPAQMKQVGIADGVPVPVVKSFEAAALPAGVRLPLFWHKELYGRENGRDVAAIADYPDTTNLLLGAAMMAVGSEGLRRASQLVGASVRQL